MIGDHTVELIPDPDVSAWGPVLNSNPYMTANLDGWVPAPTGAAWTWNPAGTAVAPDDTAAGTGLYRSRAFPIGRGASTTYRVRVRGTVKSAGWVITGLFWGTTPTAAEVGPAWAGSASVAQAIWTFVQAGAFTIDTVHNAGEIAPNMIYLGPRASFGKAMSPIVDSIELNGQGATAIDITCFLDQVTIRSGREDTDSQPEASSATLDLSTDTGEDGFPDALEVGGIIRVSTTIGGVASARFVGRVTDIALGWEEAGEDTPDRVTAQIIATGPLAELGRRVVGDVPWPQQLDGERVAAIMAAAGLTLDPNTSDPGTVQLLPRDVDSQPALDLAQEAADWAGGTVWSTRSGDVRYADAAHRRGATSSLDLDACDILVTPTWRRTTEGLINKVSIGYGPQPEEGEQPRYVAQRDDSIESFGRFEFTASTELAHAADAVAMGELLLARNRVPVWVLSELPVDVDGLDLDRTQRLLGLEMHSLVNVTGLPAAGTVPTSAVLWVEGWTETLAYGIHDLALVVSGYCRTSPPPRWDDVSPSQTWDSAISISWDDATCLGPIPSSGRWADVSASLRWNNVPAATTWDTWSA